MLDLSPVSAATTPAAPAPLFILAQTSQNSNGVFGTWSTGHSTAAAAVLLIIIIVIAAAMKKRRGGR
ncbi:hypothetical protein BH11PLA1_BH11PLA1_14150 [soil metagenome]